MNKYRICKNNIYIFKQLIIPGIMHSTRKLKGTDQSRKRKKDISNQTETLLSEDLQVSDGKLQEEMKANYCQLYDWELNWNKLYFILLFCKTNICQSALIKGM